MVMESLHLAIPLQNLLVELPVHLPKGLLQSILNLVDPRLDARTKVGGLLAGDNRECGRVVVVDIGPILALLFEFLLSLRVGVAEEVVEDGAVACMGGLLPSGSG